MRAPAPAILDAADIRARMIRARRNAEVAPKKQDRLHYEGMADYWEELLNEVEPLCAAE